MKKFNSKRLQFNSFKQKIKISNKENQTHKVSQILLTQKLNKSNSIFYNFRIYFRKKKIKLKNFKMKLHFYMVKIKNKQKKQRNFKNKFNNKQKLSKNYKTII